MRWSVAGLVALALLFWISAVRAEPPRTAFFYGRPVPPELFEHYDRVVVEPANLLSPPAPGSTRAEAFAYVSIGEIADDHALHHEAPRAALMARNPDWKADVADLTRPEWHAFVLDRLVEPLWNRGYRAYFFDTLDSFELGAKTPDARKAQTAGLTVLLEKIVQRHPTIKLVLNRGFDVVSSPRVRANVAGVAVESLYAAWDAKAKKYTTVPDSDRQWLLQQLAAVTKLKIPVTVIDYLPRERLAERREVARKIVHLGFDAWVANPELDDLGVGQTEVIPRRILVVHGGEQRLSMADVHVVGAAVLERMGYAVDYVSMKAALPSGRLSTRYAGIVALPLGYSPAQPQRGNAYRAWLLDRIHEGLPIAILENFGFPLDAEFLRLVGLAASSTSKSVRVVSSAPWTTYETKRIDTGKLLPEVRVAGAGSPTESFLRLEDASGEVGDAVAIGSWGGYVLAPYFMTGGPSDTRRFVVDPWTFFAKALKLFPAPVLDPTTEGGERILTVHIDGDGFASRSEISGTPFAAQVVEDQILARYRLPTTVSVIEGELSSAGMNPGDSSALEKIAQSTFRLPNVEIASHSFSHPFFWNKAESWQLEGGKPAHLPIPNYRFDLKRDVLGSVDYINTRLAPEGKRVKVFLWTGDCLPSGDAVEMTRAAGLLNLNGGGATQIVDSPSLTQLYPTMLPFDNGALQVYAPLQNDNVYTNHWTGPYHGFRRVIETMKLTESPRRLTPMSIYFHYFSATKPAGIKALVDVVEWALAQEPHPLYASEYVERVRAFAKATLSRRVDGTWEIVGLGPGRTLRVDPSLGYPDMRRSKGVAGVRSTAVGRYVTLSSDRVEVAFTSAPPSEPYIERSNAEVVAFRADGPGRVRVRLRGHVPIVFAVGGSRRPCVLHVGTRDVSGASSKAAPGMSVFSLHETDTGEATLACT